MTKSTSYTAKANARGKGTGERTGSATLNVGSGSEAKEILEPNSREASPNSPRAIQTPVPAEDAMPVAASQPPTGKLGLLVEMLSRPEGANIHDMAQACGWQIHSVRGALAGMLKKRGYQITSEKVEKLRIYRIKEGPAS